MTALPVALEVALVFARELVRALAVPIHLLLFLPKRGRFQARARLALEASMDAAPTDSLATFLRGRRPDGGAGGGRVFVSCGEASGEAHALNLVEGVARRCADEGRVEPAWYGFGGERLAGRGVDVRFPLADHAVMGIAGVLASIPLIVRAFSAFLRVLREDPPDLLVLIDYPGLHLVMAEAARRHGVPVLHYVAPQYWAWGPWRLARYRKAVDATLTILPFEPAFFVGSGLVSEYVGHPLLDEIAQTGDEPTDAPDQRALLVMMPGSRRKEIALQLAPMIRVAARLRRQRPELRVLIPHRDPRRAALIRDGVSAAGAQGWVEVHEDPPSRWLPHARAALVKSGTGSLEACLHRVPTCVVYVVDGAIMRFLLHRILTVPFFAGANLCMARCIVPEIGIEREQQWDDVHDHVARLLDDGPERERCLHDLDALRERLGAPGASSRAARWVVPFCSSDR